MSQILQDSSTRKAIALMWEHFGPSHYDRIKALADRGHQVIAIELFARSQVYDWDADRTRNPVKFMTLTDSAGSVGPLRLAARLVRAVRRASASYAMFSHYSDPGVFFAALTLRAQGIPVFTMLDSKEDDRKRGLVNTLLRRMSMMPYAGALVAGPRSRAYAISLGIPEAHVGANYNALDISLLRELAEGAAIPQFGARPFLIVARLVAKKNLAAALKAFAKYRGAGGQRVLEIAGEGPDGSTLKKLAKQLEIERSVIWLGNLDRKGVALVMRRSLALILPSTVEQFGYVVIEALAQGLVPIVTERAGAVDLLVDHGENGVIFDPENERELLEAMQLLDRDEVLWQSYSDAAYAMADRADCRHFAESATRLLEMVGR